MHTPAIYPCPSHLNISLSITWTVCPGFSLSTISHILMQPMQPTAKYLITSIQNQRTNKYASNKRVMHTPAIYPCPSHLNICLSITWTICLGFSLSTISHILMQPMQPTAKYLITSIQNQRGQFLGAADRPRVPSK
jgi:hypothetical protein